jgi:hypothetical protein
MNKRPRHFRAKADQLATSIRSDFHSRSVKFRVVDERTVRGVYNNIEYEIRRLDNAVQIRFVGGVNRDYKSAPIIDRHLNNLKRDLIYEPGRYLL